MTEFSVEIPSIKKWSGQFVISLAQLDILPDFEMYIINNIFIKSDIPLIPVYTRDSILIGALLGYPISLTQRKIINKKIILDNFVGVGEITNEALEDEIFSLRGRFVFIYSTEKYKRIYLDSDGTLPVVFDSNKKIIASSTGLILNDSEYLERFRRKLFNKVNVLHDGWFPSGLTAHKGVHRLLCNHYLDLVSWNTRRHWPKVDFTQNMSSDVAAGIITNEVRDTVSIITKAAPTVCSLTAGNETRLLLACSKDILKQLDFFTVNTPDTKLDVEVSKKLASKFGVNHKLLDLSFATADEQISWLYKASHTVGGSNLTTHPTVYPLSKYTYSIGGLGGEVGRAFFWRNSDNLDMELTAGNIISRFGMPYDEDIYNATVKWFKTVEQFCPYTQLDLAYLELRMSAWGFAAAYTQNNTIQFHPLISRNIYSVMLNINPSEKKKNIFIRDGVRRQWPDLLEFPINKYGDYRDVIHILQKIFTPSMLKRKLRKKFGNIFSRS